MGRLFNSGIFARNVDSVNGQTGEVVLTKADVGLGNVDNTSDMDKPISTAVQAALESLKTSDLSFIGYISSTEPSASTYNLVSGNLWYNSSTVPSTLPIAAADLKEWNGSAWVSVSSSYMPDDLDAWKCVDDGETYVYFAGEWQDYAPQLSPSYFELDGTTSKWVITSDIALTGHPTVENAPTADMGIANKSYVDAIAGDFKRGLYDNGTTVTYAASTTISLADNTTVYTLKPTGAVTLAFDTSELTIPTNALTTFYLVLDMSAGLQTITWPSNVQWGNITPTMTANVNYMFAFTKPYGANIWIGNQMYSWEA